MIRINSLDNLKSRIGVMVLGLALLPAAALATSWTNVPLVDLNCSKRVQADPDAHTRDCAVRCAESGYGVWTAEEKYLKFDAEGSKLALAVLQAAERVDHLRVDVVGELEGDTIHVESIVMAERKSSEEN